MLGLPVVELFTAAPERRVWSVGALVLAVADALAVRFAACTVRGELSGFSRAASGHCYFTLKDAEGAQASLRCAMFRRAASLLDEVISITRTSLPSSEVVNKLAGNSALGQVLAAGVRSVIAEPRLSERALRLVFENAGRVCVHRLERYLNTLGTIATAAPLLGLFGTVVGMIEIFGSQAPTGGSNPAQLAHGISVALYNTAFGLMIAIPSLMFYRYFRGRIDEFTVDMEQSAERLVPHLMRFAVKNKE